MKISLSLLSAIFALCSTGVLANAHASELTYETLQEHAKQLGESLSVGAVDNENMPCSVSYSEDAQGFLLTLESEASGKFTAAVRKNSVIQVQHAESDEGFQDQVTVDELTSLALVHLPDAFDTASITYGGNTIACGAFR